MNGLCKTIAHAIGATLASIAVLLPPAAAAAYPDHTVTIVVPFPAGGTTDILARIMATALAARMHQSFVVENRPGAGGNIGAALVAKAAPDGYTLVMGTVGTHAINMSLYKDTRATTTVKDFAPITRVANVPNVLEVPAAEPYQGREVS